MNKKKKLLLSLVSFLVFTDSEAFLPDDPKSIEEKEVLIRRGQARWDTPYRQFGRDRMPLALYTWLHHAEEEVARRDPMVQQRFEEKRAQIDAEGIEFQLGRVEDAEAVFRSKLYREEKPYRTEADRLRNSLSEERKSINQKYDLLKDSFQCALEVARKSTYYQQEKRFHEHSVSTEFCLIRGGKKAVTSSESSQEQGDNPIGVRKILTKYFDAIYHEAMVSASSHAACPSWGDKVDQVLAKLAQCEGPIHTSALGGSYEMVPQGEDVGQMEDHRSGGHDNGKYQEERISQIAQAFEQITTTLEADEDWISLKEVVQKEGFDLSRQSEVRYQYMDKNFDRLQRLSMESLEKKKSSELEELEKQYDESMEANTIKLKDLERNMVEKLAPLKEVREQLYDRQRKISAPYEAYLNQVIRSQGDVIEQGIIRFLLPHFN